METTKVRPGSVYVDTSQLAWEPTHFAGVSCKVLYRDPAGEAFTALFKFEAGGAAATASPRRDRTELRPDRQPRGRGRRLHGR